MSKIKILTIVLEWSDGEFSDYLKDNEFFFTTEETKEKDEEDEDVTKEDIEQQLRINKEIGDLNFKGRNHFQ